MNCMVIPASSRPATLARQELARCRRSVFTTVCLLGCCLSLNANVFFTYDPSGNPTSVVATASSLSGAISNTSQTLTISNQLSLSVLVGGNGPVSYQWRLNGSDITDATDATLYNAAVGTADAGEYSVVISNATAVVTNQAGTVTVLATNTALYGLAYGGGRYVGVGVVGAIVTSTDLISWTAATSGATNQLEAVAYGNSLFVAVGSAGKILTSTNGLNWTAQSSGNTNDLKGVTYGGGLFVAVGWGGTTITSTNGTNWATQTFDTMQLEAVTWGTNRFVAVGRSGVIWASSNGTNWNNVSYATNAHLSSVVYGGGKFVVVGTDGLILTSTNSTSWTVQISGTVADFEAVAFYENTFVALGPVGKNYLSSDAVHWAPTSSGTFDVMRAAVVGANQLVAVGDNGTILPVPFAVVDHYEWSFITSPQRAGQSFSATVTAKDAAGNTVTDATGTLTVSSFAAAAASDTILGNLSPYDSVTNAGSLTLGYLFTPSRDLLVTHFRHYSGTNVSVWTQEAELLAQIAHTNTPGSWTETPLSVPLRLNAGNTYVISATGTNLHYRFDGTNVFNDGTIDQGLEIATNTFPGVPSNTQWALVDLRYQVERPQAAAVSPSSATLANGVATVSVTVTNAGTNLVLTATDSIGRTGASTPFQVLAAGDLALRMAASPDPANTLADLTYTLTVLNAGPGDSTGVSVTNTLPANCVFQSATASQGTVQHTNGLVTATLGTLTGQTEATVTIVVRPTTPGIMLTNTATVSRNETETNTVNNTATGIAYVVPLLSIDDTYSGVVEGNLGYVTNRVYVNLSQASPLAVRFDYFTTSGTASNNSDFVPVSGPASLPPGFTSGWIDVLVNGDTAIEADESFVFHIANAENAAIQVSQKTFWITNDDGIGGQVDHFVWNTIGTPRRINTAFAASITAKDAAGNTATNFNGSAALTGVNPGGTNINHVLNYDYHTVARNDGTYTLGFEFIPTNNIIVTHVRHYSGTKVSLWTAGGSLLSSTAVSSTPGQWTETKLSTPVFLSTNNSYRVGFLTGGEPYFGRIEPPSGFAHGIITNRFYALGDAFPAAHDFSYWYLVDLRYVLPASLTPTTASFTNGSWNGNLTIQETGTSIVILADDLDGHKNWSNPFHVYATNDLAVMMQISSMSPIVGSNLTYTVWALNSGPDTATGVWLTNVLPADVTLVSATPSQGTCTTNDGIVTCDLGNVSTTANVIIVVVPNVAGSAITNTATVTRNETDADLSNNSAALVLWPSLDLALLLAEATGMEGYPWRSSGPVLWGSQTNVTHDGISAAQSGAIGHNQTTWMRTIVRGPGTLSFWWKVSSEQYADYLEYYTNLVLHSRISGSVDWQQVTVSVPSGLFTNHWQYKKDGDINSGSDAGWVDQITFTVPSFSLGSPVMPANGQFQLTLTTTNGQQLIVQGSDDLILWTSLATNTATGGTISFTDTQATNYPYRFYRAIHRNSP